MGRNKQIFAYIFFWGLGLMGLGMAIHSGLTGKGPTGQILIITEASNFFIRYSLQLMIALISISSILLPVFFSKGGLNRDAPSYTKSAKAKCELILYTIFFTGMFFGFLGGGYRGSIASTGKITAGLFILFYLYKIVSFIKTYREEK